MRCACFAIFWLASLSCTAAAMAPEITLDWVGVHEQTLCNAPADLTRFEAAKREAEQRLPEFQKAWARHGPVWLSRTEKLIGREFQYQEALTTLTVCADQPWGTSYPLTTNLEWFLSAYDGRYRNHPLWEELFAERVFHEVLHRYIRDIVGRGAGQPMRDTPIMAKYSSEPFVTRAHLHIVAIERVLFGPPLGRSELLSILRQDHQDAPAYARAYQIVDKEGTDAVIADLRSASSR